MSKIKAFFGRLFATKAYTDSLTAGQLAAKIFKGETLYNYAYNQAKIDHGFERIDDAIKHTAELDRVYHAGRMHLIAEMWAKNSGGPITPKVTVEGENVTYSWE